MIPRPSHQATSWQMGQDRRAALRSTRSWRLPSASSLPQPGHEARRRRSPDARPGAGQGQAGQGAALDDGPVEVGGPAGRRSARSLASGQVVLAAAIGYIGVGRLALGPDAGREPGDHEHDQGADHGRGHCARGALAVVEGQGELLAGQAGGGIPRQPLNLP
jgi:hypothetical protein